MTAMFRDILLTGLAALLLAAACLAIAPPSAVSAQSVKDNICGGTDINLGDNEDRCASVDKCAQEKDGVCVARASENRLNNTVKAIINTLTVIVGVVAIAFIVIAGAKFVASGGDSGKVSSARNTALYAIVGLIIVALAQVIVRFVLSRT